MGARSYYVYILASRIGGTLYIGVTNDLIRRAYEHRSKAVPGFTKKYGVTRLVYFEQFGDIEFAIRREKRLKKWPRSWKIRLIEEANAFSVAERRSLTGLETWFDVAGAPPRWKMAITTFAGVYPVAYLVLRFVGPHETTWPASLRALLTAGILVPSLTWIVMPRLTKLLRRWLRP